MVLIRYGKDFNVPLFAKTIVDTLDQEKLLAFQDEVEPILQSYRQAMKKVNSFLTAVIPDNRAELVKILDRFIIAAKKYSQVDVIYEKNVCLNCLSIFRCDCGTIRTTTQIKNKNDYEDEDNFMKALLRYQGKQSRKIDFDALTKELDKSFSQYDFPVSNEIKAMEYNDDGRSRSKTSVSKMISALSEIKKPHLYEDVNLICHEYWGWKLPDVSDIQEQILDDYRRTQKIYLTLEKKRKSCLNLQYRIFKHLQILGVQVKISDFRIPTTVDILKEHDLLWKQMCLGTKLQFIPTI